MLNDVESEIMKEEVYRRILDRNEPKKMVETHFKENLELLKEIANYGSNLIPRCFVSSDRHLIDVVVLACFLKHAVGMIDAIEILLSEGAVNAANVQLRSLFESRISLHWILKEESVQRANQFYVWYLRRKRFGIQRIISGTPEQDLFQHTIDKSPYKFKLPFAEKSEEFQEDLESIDKTLNHPEFKKINEEFDRIKRRSYDKPWYTPWGPNSISDMAQRLGFELEYDIFYTQLSEISHSQSLDSQVSFKEERIRFEPIRNLKEIDTILRMTLGMAVDIYRLILNHYRPSEIVNFNKKHMEEWRERFLKIKKVNYSDGDTLII